MSLKDKQAAEMINDIAHAREGKLRHPVMSGKVISVDEDDMTAKILLNTNDESAPTEEININVVLSNAGGVLMVPAEDAYCLVAEVDGPGKWEVLKASSYTKVMATIGTSKLTMTSAGFKLEHNGQNFKTVMDGFFNHIAAMTFTNSGGVTGPPNNVTALTADKTLFDQIFV